VGAAFTVTLVVTGDDVQPNELVTVSVYVPVAAVVTLPILGFCADEVNEFGPDHAYDDALAENRFRFPPAQSGLLLDGDARGVGFTVTLVVTGDDVQPNELVTVSVYVPVAAVVTLPILGFCADEENEFGPDQLYDDALAENRFSVPPAQTGLLLEADAVGVGFTVTVKLHVD
jgi:hypothetical protein